MGNQDTRVLGIVLAGCGVLAACARPADIGARGSAGDVGVRHAVAWSAADVKAATVGMEISNDGRVTDTLIAITSSAGSATLHTEVPGQGMRPVAGLPLPPRETIRIGRGLHVMVESLKDAPAPGGMIPLTLRFAHAGAIDVSVPVLRYSEALTALGE